MRQLTRRSLIGRALAAGAGASVLTGLEAGAAHGAVSLQPDPATGYDPGFLMGTIVSTSSFGTYEVADENGVVQKIAITDPGAVWKRGAQGRQGLSNGDPISARGTRDSGATLHVAAAWIDIQSLKVTVTKRGSTQLEVETAQWPGSSLPVGILPVSEIFAPPNTQAAAGDASAVGVGDVVQLIGFGDLTGGAFTATRLFVLKSIAHPATGGGPDDQVLKGAPVAQGATPYVTCPYTYYGITTYFDCSGNGACNSCNYCSSSYNQMAWPEMNYCGGSGLCAPDCSGCASCCSGLPQIVCGSTVNIYGRCTHKGVSVTVADCGPCVHCVSPFGCQGYRTVKFDLTRAAFSAIAPLSYGMTDIQATVYLRC